MKTILVSIMAMVFLSGCVTADKVQRVSKRSVVGSWYEKIGHPILGDATLTIYSENNQYYISRKNGDGSQGKYLLTKSGNKYIKNHDNLGAYYVVTNTGLKIYDKMGYIRTAKRIK
jgi:hypothetical protein